MLRKTRMAVLAVPALLLAGLSLEFFAQEPGQPPPPHEWGERHVNIPYFLIGKGYSSRLLLNNNRAHRMEARVLVYNQRGEALQPLPVELGPLSATVFDLEALLGRAGPKYQSGNLEIVFQGTQLALTCQLTVFSASRRTSFESFETRRPASGSTRLDGIVRLPRLDSRAEVALTNVGLEDLIVDVSNGSRQSRSILLSHRETQLISLDGFIDRRPGASTAELITLEHSGRPGDLVTTGYVLGASGGFSKNLTFTDRSAASSSRLAATDFRFGPVHPDAGFPPGTRFEAPLVLANAGQAKVEVEAWVSYTRDGAHDRVLVKQGELEAGELWELELAGEMAARGVAGPVETAGLDIVYSGPDGSVLADLTNVDAGGDFSFPVPVRDPEAGLTPGGDGSYPWRIDDGYSTVLYLKNVTAEPVHSIVQVRYPGGDYNPERIRLEPFQTVALDLQRTRDEQQPDVRDQLMPLDVTGGQVVWYEEVPNSVIGRAEIKNVAAGIASHFSCEQCCGVRHEEAWMAPGFVEDMVGAVGDPFDILETRKDYCTGIEYGPYNMNNSSEWDSSDYSVVTTNGPTIECVGGGQAGVTAQFETTVAHGVVCVAIVGAITRGGTMQVREPTWVENTFDDDEVGPCSFGVAQKRRIYKAFDQFGQIQFSMFWTLHETVTSPTDCDVSTGDENVPGVGFVDIIRNCVSGCTFESEQRFSVRHMGITYNLAARECSSSPCSTSANRTGWKVTATTQEVDVEIF